MTGVQQDIHGWEGNPSLEFGPCGKCQNNFLGHVSIPQSLDKIK